MASSHGRGAGRGVDAGESWVFGRGCGSTGCPPSPKVFGARPHPAAPRTRPRGVEHPEAMRFKRGWKREGRGGGGSASSGSRPIAPGPAAQGTREPPGTPRQGLRLRQLPPLPASGTFQGQRASWRLRHRPSVGREMCRLRGSVLGRSRHPPTAGQGIAAASAFRPPWHF